jgi:hypothetical protein
MEDEKKAPNQEVEVILTFIKQTKDGQYAPIEKSSLSIPRKDSERIEIPDDCEYYYSIR